VEVIALATDILQALGLKNLTFYLNSVGDRGDRSRYREALVDYLTPYAADLDDDSRDRLTRNPLRILTAKTKRPRPLPSWPPAFGLPRPRL
jgi:histidyl-tRNA synthetase